MRSVARSNALKRKQMNRIFTNLRAKTFIFGLIFVFALFSQTTIFAQKKSSTVKIGNPKAEPPKTEMQGAVKVTQVDDAKLKEILKPKDGKPLLVNFWATWCDPCREEFPDLVKIENDYRGKLDVITVSLDEVSDINTEVPKFLSGMKAETVNYLLASEDESALIGSITKEWSGGLPFTILFNEKGEIIYFKQGKFKTDILKSEIDKLTNSATAEISNQQILKLPVTKEVFTYEKGLTDAKNDIANGKYMIKYYGLVPMASKEYSDKLKQKHGIEIIYNGCLVSSGEVEYGKGYNEISIAAIKKKFGEKVLE